MKCNKAGITSVIVGAAAWLSGAQEARANLSECGDIFVTGDAKCEFHKTKECMTECTTEAVETSCSAKIYTSCERGCTASATTTCETSCSEVCTTDCEAKVDAEEPPDCVGLCVSDCQQTCDDAGTCGSGKRGPCRSCCSYNCNARCEEQCEDMPEKPAAVEECMPTCTSACSGSCTAQANVQCQVDCQTDVYTECETELVKTCKTQCEDKGGAIFCDGKFVNAKSAKSCASELKDKFDFNISVDVDVDVDGEITTVTDKGKKTAKASCSVAHVGDHAGDAGWSLLTLVGLAFVVTRKRHR